MIILIVGFFIFPVWWGGCCQLCNPNQSPCARSMNITSTVLGILWALWIPSIIIWSVVAATAVTTYPYYGSGWYYYYYFY